MFFLFLLGVALVVFFVLAQIQTRKYLNYELISATVTSVTRQETRINSETISHAHDLVTLDFTYHGINYLKELNCGFEENMYVGQTLPIRFDPTTETFVKEQSLRQNKSQKSYIFLVVAFTLFVICALYMATKISPSLQLFWENTKQYIILTVVSIVFLIIAIFIFYKQYCFSKARKQHNFREIPATCVAYFHGQSSSSGPTHYMYFPIFEYEFDGRTQQIKSRIGSSGKKYKIGSKIMLYKNYKTDKIEEKTSTFLLFGFISIGVGLLGSVLLVISLMK